MRSPLPLTDGASPPGHLRGHDRVREFSWEDSRPEPGRLLSASWRRRDRGRGRGRGQNMRWRAMPANSCSRCGASAATSAELLARPDAGVEPIAFAAGSRPATCRGVPWIDLSRPSGGIRYELWHRTRPGGAPRRRRRARTEPRSVRRCGAPLA
jgi:hypothetical protein